MAVRPRRAAGFPQQRDSKHDSWEPYDAPGATSRLGLLCPNPTPKSFPSLGLGRQWRVGWREYLVEPGSFREKPGQAPGITPVRSGSVEKAWTPASLSARDHWARSL
jgi:hypothetical protein